MRNKDEIQTALQARIKQLDQGLKVLNTTNGPYLTRAIYESVKEELETLHKWILNIQKEKRK